jgi:hypothetical protein
MLSGTTRARDFSEREESLSQGKSPAGTAGYQVGAAGETGSSAPVVGAACP